MATAVAMRVVGRATSLSPTPSRRSSFLTRHWAARQELTTAPRGLSSFRHSVTFHNVNRNGTVLMTLFLFVCNRLLLVCRFVLVQISVPSVAVVRVSLWPSMGQLRKKEIPNCFFFCRWRPRGTGLGEILGEGPPHKPHWHIITKHYGHCRRDEQLLYLQLRHADLVLRCIQTVQERGRA